jgi:methylenetetrahydrofolate reductase (NADPH)
MEKSTFSPTLDRVRYEVLPLGRGEEEAAKLPGPVRLTVTCSPKYGPDRSVEVATRLRELGHAVTVHVAARMVRDRAHADSLMHGMAAAGIDDVFVIGGDADPPQGEFSSAVELVPVIAEHPERPRTIGIAGYPEGHPKISQEALDEALREKSRYSDYVTTQMCFDADAMRSWVRGHREQGMTLPVLIGLPGKADRRRLLEMSVRIGVGPSLAFLRKQRGLLSLLSRRSTADRLYDAIAPSLDDPELNLAGLHYFTFNQLVDTWQWHESKHRAGTGGDRRRDPAAPKGYVHPEERTT